MAYENYSFVSWSEGTPITSVRLHQMSTNIAQVKDATDPFPKGLLRIKELTSDSPNSSTVSANIVAAYKVIALENEGGGVDNRTTLENGRRYKITLVFPGIKVTNPGGEDSTYKLSIKAGTFGNGTNISTFYLNSGIGAFVNTQTAAVSSLSGFIAPTSNANSNIAIATINRINSRDNLRFGAGTYSYILSGNGATNISFFAEVQKDAGSSGANNISTYAITGSETPMQFFIEDIGRLV